MNEAEASLHGQLLARTISSRAKALETLRSARRPSFWLWLTTMVGMSAVMIGLTGLIDRLPFWPTVVITAVCASSVAATTAFWHSQRQLLAVIDLLLLDEDRKRGA